MLTSHKRIVTVLISMSNIAFAVPALAATPSSIPGTRPSHDAPRPAKSLPHHTPTLHPASMHATSTPEHARLPKSTHPMQETRGISLSGIVTSVSGDTITITTRKHGKTETTSVSTAGVTILGASKTLSVGDRVHLMGTKDAQGVITPRTLLTSPARNNPNKK